MYKEENNDDDNDNAEEEYGPKLVSSSDCAWIPKLFEGNYRTTQLVFKRKEGVTITCLRQPRDLYALTKTATQAHPKWPSEIQLVIERPSHILYTPVKPEPLQWNVGNQIVASQSSGISGRVIYDNTLDPEHKYFISSKSDNKIENKTIGGIANNNSDKTLLFESRFESGNLMRAVKVGEYEYELWLKFDLYTKKHTQWYYFQIENAKPNIVYKFTIMNFLKSGSLYNEGMKPLMYSVKDANEKNIGWVRTGENIKYYKNDIRVDDSKDRNYYSLQWTMQFPNANDTYYLAHSYPYTYSDLQEYLNYLAFHPQRKRYCKQKLLCQTLAGNHVYVLTVTSPTRCPKQAKLKKAIVVSARVHPGETVASWMMKGFLDYITSEEKDAKILRDTFVFKIVPMLNPDGVIVGNYRCSLSGRDLNRNYKSILKDSFPSVWHIKNMIKKLHEEREVVLYCDFHGHSRKKNVFIYGCENTSDKVKGLYTRVFPLMLAKNAKDKFSFDACRFHIQKSKEGTGRVVMWNLGIKYSYTLEASFCGSSLVSGKSYHFGVQDYEEMGYHFCDTLLDFFDPDSSKFNMLLGELQLRMETTLIRRMKDKGVSSSNVVVSMDTLPNQFVSDSESESCGSDSSFSDGLPMQLLYGSPKEVGKKKRLRSRKERNKRRKKNIQKNNLKIKKDENNNKSVDSSRDLSPTKSFKKRETISRHFTNSKISYSSKKSRDNRKSYDCLTPTRISSTGDYLDTLTYSYVQAGLTNNSTKENRPPCEKCHPSYYMSYSPSNTSDVIPSSAREQNPIYSLFEIRMPSHSIETNPTLELARKITAYNYRTGKLAPRLSRVLSIWTKGDRRKELLQRQTVDQEDNADYLRKKLVHLSSDDVERKICSDTALNERRQMQVVATADSVDFSPPSISPSNQMDKYSNNVCKKNNCPKYPLPRLNTIANSISNKCTTSGLIRNKDRNFKTRSFDIGLEHSIQKVTPLTAGRDTPSPTYFFSKLHPKLNSRSSSSVKVESYDRNEKFKERLVPLEHAGKLFKPASEKKIHFSTAAGHLPRSSKSESFELTSKYDPSTETNAMVHALRALTPQQCCIFSELDDSE